MIISILEHEIRSSKKNKKISYTMKASMMSMFENDNELMIGVEHLRKLS